MVIGVAQRYAVEDIALSAIGDALRAKLGETQLYRPSEMAPAILRITSAPTDTPTPSPDNSTFAAATDFKLSKCIRNVCIPEGCVNIGNACFNGCDQLESVYIPNTIQKIFGGAFNGCTKLEEIRIPASVNSLGDSVFYGCSNLRALYFLGTTPPALYSSSSLQGLPKDTIIYVPSESLEAYKTKTNWVVYANRI